MKIWMEELVNKFLNDPKYSDFKLDRKAKKSKVFNPKTAHLNENGSKFSSKDYINRMKVQNDECEICRTRLPKLVIDHDHTSGLVRGLLCSGCNSGLGFFRDSLFTVVQAAKYLRRYKIYKINA